MAGQQRGRGVAHSPTRPLLLVVLLLALGSLASCAASSSSLLPAALTDSTTEQPVLIVEYVDQAVTAAAAAAAAAASVSTAADREATVAAAAAAAQQAAVSRGASSRRQAAIASLAADSAAAAPAVAAVTSTVVAAAAAAGVQVTGLTHYHTVMKGAAIKTANLKQAAALRKVLKHHPSVRHVYMASSQALVKPIKGKLKAKTQQQQRRGSKHSSSSSSAANLDTALYSVTGVNKLRERGLDGSGVLVCVVDTGINFGQPSYGECTAVNHPDRRCKVVAGYNFVGDAYSGTRQGASPVAGGQPTDCMGHGSMVASVVGTKGGVAPGVTLGAYRVFGCDGYVGDNVLIEAIDRAVRDGCDVINLSLASGSGYAETSIYNSVMKSAMSKGVIVVKAAGNAGSDGPFRADVATAVGAITVASVDASKDSSSGVSVSKFSSYGPNPTLDLLPHIAAPGDDVPVRNKDGSKDTASGTSFAAPYVSGILALWLQHKQAQQEGGERDDIGHDAALRGLVATAKGVPDKNNPKFLESVALMGAGLAQADAFVSNQLEVSPSMLQVPTGLEDEPYTTSFKVAWDGPPLGAGGESVTYRVVHQPSVSIPLSDGWYGTKVAIKKVYAAADVSFSKGEVTVDTTHPTPVTIKVTFNLPEALQNKRLLFSGLIRLLPTPGQPGVPAVTLPYQGFAAPLQHLRLAARPAENSADGDKLKKHTGGLCYSPRATPSFYLEVMDHLAKVPEVCSGGLALSEDQVVKVDFDVLHSSPECSLRVTLAPEVPLERLHIDLLDEGGDMLGSLEPLVPSSGGALAKTRQVMSYCTRFDGTYTDGGGRQQVVDVGGHYRLRVHMHGPVSLADQQGQQHVTARVDEVLIKGVLLVTAKGTPSRS